MASQKPKQEEQKPQVPATQQVQGNTNLPAYLKGHTGGSGLQGLDASDFVIPRVKLLQGLSPEVTAFDAAKIGEFWLSVVDTPLGGTLEIVVVKNRKRVMLLRPLGDTGGSTVLARAEDAIHWTPDDGEWQVRLKNVKNLVTWKTAPTVRESGLLEFGSSNPEDRDSNPAATMFYEFLCFMPKRPDVSPVLLSLARSGAKWAKDLQGKIEFGGAPMQARLFEVSSWDDKSSEGPFKNWKFRAAGFVSEETYKHCLGLSERYKTYRAADEEQMANEQRAGGTPPAADSKEY